eukprot:scaffold91088_cov66-Phaeocystis_antarctica.AAC.1
MARARVWARAKLRVCVCAPRGCAAGPPWTLSLSLSLSLTLSLPLVARLAVARLARLGPTKAVEDQAFASQGRGRGARPCEG